MVNGQRPAEINLYPFVGPGPAQAAYVSTRATFVMADANAMVGTLQGLLTKPLERVITAMFTVLGLKK